MSNLSSAGKLGLPSEITEVHSRLLRLSMVIEESRAYWAHSQTERNGNTLPTTAFEQRWFGDKSMTRVRLLLSDFAHRFDAYPAALTVLRQWHPNDPLTCINICHWHTQLTDPLYRVFTGVFLEQRRLLPQPTVDREVVARWVEGNMGRPWAPATVIRMADSLLTCASSAGLCTQKAGVRNLIYPKVTDEALVYWLYFLRHLDFAGTLLTNPYLASVGLSDGFLEQRLRRLPGLSFQRMGDLTEFIWEYPDLLTWAEAALKPKQEVSI
jgi:hypothetical protein